MDIRLTINGNGVSATVEDRTSLADFLRSPARGCTSVHLGCEHGVCGACTVVLDGRIQRSCITLASACDGADVWTLEGLKDDPLTLELKDAFNRNHGLQCGFCTPGMIISAREIISNHPGIDEETLRLNMAGNICRCTGFSGIVKSILDVSERLERQIEE